MENYIGIDLGTTNSAICSYDKDTLQTRVWKSPEVNDVTPSAIYIDRRGNKHVGQTAYNAAPRSPDNCAKLFKRFMGTTTPIELSAVNLTLTPEECSAEILKTLFGYLPEEIRNSADTGTVITVPAAFNQMQKNATMEAAEMAGIGKVELVQEPVAAVMSFVKARNTDGIFLIYDLGGGTLDISIAESIKKRVNIFAHGGIQMCGGRDFDRTLVDNLVCPWLHENFELPDDLSTNPTFKPLLSLATWATERAKIELSAKDEAIISLSEVEVGTNDLNGDEIYLDIPLQREFYNNLIADRVNDTIHAARDTLSKTGYTPNDIECIVWVGGPTHYKPLRDKVSFELGIKGDILAVDPMTAVAEGASIFAEPIFNNQNSKNTKKRKDADVVPQSPGEPILTFRCINRTPDDTSKIAVQIEGQVPSGYEFQVNNLDDGWTSGRLPLKHGEIVNVNLMKPGENTFEAIAYDAGGKPIKRDEIVITKEVAKVEGIPASSRIALEVVKKIGGRSVPEYLVTEHDKLPKEGTILLTAGESIEAGSDKSLNFYLWEGEIHDIISDNRAISCLQIKGKDFAEGIIPENADLKCSYEVPTGGNIKFEVEVEIGGIPKKFDFVYDYKRENPTPAASQVAEDGIQIRKRIDQLNELVGNNPKLERLERAEQKIELSLTLAPEETDNEKIQETYNANLEAKTLLFQVREENRKKIRQSDLDNVVKDFNMYSRQHVRPSEETAFDNLVETAQRSMDNNDDDFNEHLDELRGRDFEILWHQDWFVIDMFKHLANSSHLFADQDRFEELVHIGKQLLEHPEIREILAGRREATIKSEVVDQLRGIVAQIMSIPRIGGFADRDLIANVLVKQNT